MPSDADESASQQLQNDLQSVETAHVVRRPILTHLNADTTWLLSIPYPSQDNPPPGRCRFNILIDPWLKGPQTDYYGWFSTQWHVIKSSVETIAELDVLLRDAENLELESLGIGNTKASSVEAAGTYVDLVVTSHEFTDHCHKKTLLEVQPQVPVFATTKAAELVSSWSHFTTVIKIPLFSEKMDWRAASLPPLPKWLAISRLVTRSDALYFHSAVIVCIQQANSESADAVVYTPHGVEAATFSAFNSADPPVRTLAFLHGLHDVSIALSKQLNLGAYNALKAQRQLQSKYWIGTHDEEKKQEGIIAPFLKRKAHTVLDALKWESKQTDFTVENKISLAEISCVNLGSGESLVLK